MDELEDELDLKYHRGLKPDVYYKCPSTETLDGALQNELQRNANRLIPVEIVTEFVFARDSTITIPAVQQVHLEALGIIRAEYPQSITVEYALCPEIEDSKECLKAQRPIARSILDIIQVVDGYKYTERHALHHNGDGTRFKYVCVDSLQNTNRKSHGKKGKGAATQDEPSTSNPNAPPTYDCGGAVHIKFSKKRDAINIIYKHNPIHGPSAVQDENGGYPVPEHPPQPTPVTSDGPAKPKRKRRTKAEMEAAHAAKEAATNGYTYDATLDMATSPETSRSPSKKKKRKSTGAPASPASARKKQKKVQQAVSRASINGAMAQDPDSDKPVKTGACLRCREKKIKCNEAQPTCNQCLRGLWACEYKIPKSRSKQGCFNCRQRKRKCNEQKPVCSYCTKTGEECHWPYVE